MTEGSLSGWWSSVGAKPERTGSTIWRERDKVQFDLHRRDLSPTDGAVGRASGACVVLTVLGDLDMAGAPALPGPAAVPWPGPFAGPLCLLQRTFVAAPGAQRL